MKFENYIAVVAGKEFEQDGMLGVRVMSLQALSEVDAQEYVFGLSKEDLLAYDLKCVVACVPLTADDYTLLFADRQIPNRVPSIEVFSEQFVMESPDPEVKLPDSAML